MSAPISPGLTRRNSWRENDCSIALSAAPATRMPGGAKKLIWTTSGSSEATRTCRPPVRSPTFSSCRFTVGGATRRSATCTPVETSPAMIARFTIRDDGCESRLHTTRAPRESVVP